MNENQPAQIMPMIAVASVDATRDFYVDKLGFSYMMAVVGRDGQIDFCTVLKDGAKIMFTRSETPEVPVPSTQLYIQVRDVDGYHQMVSASGVEATPPEDMWWGDRVFILTDNNGYKLWCYQSVGQPVPPEGMKIV